MWTLSALNDDDVISGVVQCSIHESRVLLWMSVRKCVVELEDSRKMNPWLGLSINLAIFSLYVSSNCCDIGIAFRSIYMS